MIFIYLFMGMFYKPIMRPIVTYFKNYGYKAAICISGETRHLKPLQLIMQQLILPFEDYDIYLHTSFRDPSIREKCIDLLKPKHMIEKTYTNMSIPEMVFKRIYELNKYIDHDNYDIIIRIRPDILLSEPLKIYDIKEALQDKLCATMLLSATYILGMKEFISDTFFFSSPKIMNIMANLYLEYKKIAFRCGNPEAFLYNFIQQNKINVYYIKTEIGLIDYSPDSNKYYMIRMLSKIKHAPILNIKDCKLLYEEEKNIL